MEDQFYQSPSAQALNKALEQMDSAIGALQVLDPPVAGWQSVCGAARLLEQAAYSLAGSESSVSVSRLILIAAELERFIEAKMPGRLVR